MEALRKYLINDEIINNLIGSNIFLVEKPEKLNAKDYIIYNFKELNGGFIKSYSIEFNIIGKDLSKLIKIKERLIDLIDDPRNDKIIKDEKTTIRTSHLLSGGGMVKNPETGNYTIVVFFVVQI